MSKDVIIFGIDMTSSVHTDSKKKYILFLGIGPTQRLDDTALSAEAQYSINFSRSNNIFCLSLHYNGSNSILFVNATKIYQFKAKGSEIKNITCAYEIFQEIIGLQRMGLFTIILLIIRLLILVILLIFTKI